MLPIGKEVRKAQESLQRGGDTYTMLGKLRQNGNRLQGEGKALEKTRKGPWLSP